ncbi:unnamed protein product [Heligmosomoides polygyrus]|uniref:Reverse transcriptase domain-containing protein n=1 Tax=Heligmosomoides polygyrus TaxID=6339 RepID=A0A183G492_HELPZ|nr:unnamed protein product [Heligmosomoides polygyrus]
MEVQVVAEKKVPECWRQNTTIPICKKKGSQADCSSCRPIRLLRHSMKIFERIVDGRIRDIVQFSSNQCGFVADCGTVDAIHVARLLIEKHREKQKSVHIAFLDLEKAFDRVPREVIYSKLAGPEKIFVISRVASYPEHYNGWGLYYALRQHGIPEELIEWVLILYSCPKSRVQAAAGTSMEFPISVGVHQRFALSPLLFVVVIGSIT